MTEYDDKVIPLEELGKMGTVKVYNQAYVDKLELKIKKLTQHLELQSMSALFEQMEEKVNQKQKIKELEEENTKLKEKINYLSEQIQELKIELDTPESVVLDKLDEAKEIIRNLLRVTYGEGWNYSLGVKAYAEQFLGELKC